MLPLLRQSSTTFAVIDPNDELDRSTFVVRKCVAMRKFRKRNEYIKSSATSLTGYYMCDRVQTGNHTLHPSNNTNISISKDTLTSSRSRNSSMDIINRRRFTYTSTNTSQKHRQRPPAMHRNETKHNDDMKLPQFLWKISQSDRDLYQGPKPYFVKRTPITQSKSKLNERSDEYSSYALCSQRYTSIPRETNETDYKTRRRSSRGKINTRKRSKTLENPKLKLKKYKYDKKQSKKKPKKRSKAHRAVHTSLYISDDDAYISYNDCILYEHND